MVLQNSRLDVRQPNRWPAARLVLAMFSAMIGSGCHGAEDGPRGPGGGFDLAGVEVQTFETSESISAVKDLDVRPDGSVWVLNSVEPLFVRFDPMGNVAQAYGRLGDGPDEFTGPSGFVVGGLGGRAWMFDRGRHLMIEVSDPESVLRLPEDVIPRGSVVPGINIGWSDLVRMESLEEELVLPRRSGASEGGILSVWRSAWTADLVALDPETGSARTVVALAEVLGDPRPHFDVEGAFLPFPLWFRLWAVCSDSNIYVYDRLRNEVRRFTADGEELQAVSLPEEPVAEVSREEYTRTLFFAAAIEAAPAIPPSGRIELSPADSAQIMQALEARVTAAPDRLANLLPRYLDLRCDEAGTLWLQRFDLDEGGLEGSPVWISATGGGDWNKVRFPRSFSPLRFTPERVWGVRQDEFDLATIGWISIAGIP